jgi:hypothetical protein
MATYNQSDILYSSATTTYNQVSATISRTATGSGVGTQTATGVHIRVRTATGSGTGTSTTTFTFFSFVYSDGSSTATGTSSTTTFHIKVRTATGSGVGTQSASQTTTVIRQATASGIGNQSATSLLTAKRTATATGTGTSVVVGARLKTETATGSGASIDVFAQWMKSHIFRVPITEGYPFAVRLSDSSPDRLFSHTPQGSRAKNLYRLTDGSYTTTDPRRPELITRIYYGGHDIFLTDPEITELTAAGYGSSIT